MHMDKQMNNRIRVRFAPSPTGFLHVGGLRTALYNFLFARQHGGTFIVRIEDTDQKRFVTGATENLLSTLSWAGLAWDEGPCISTHGEKDEINQSSSTKGSRGPYIQSQRLDIYREHVNQLISRGKAYYCFCSPEDLDAMRQEQMQHKKPPMYDRRCRALAQDTVQMYQQKKIPFVVRLKVPDDEQVIFHDLIRGKIGFNSNMIDDQILLKSDGYPTYHLAGVVDDHLMEISHVIRAEEWLSSTPKHLLLYRAFGWDAPLFAHLPLLLNPDRTKLSKRQGDVAVEEYRAHGYLKEAIVNFVALLGWNPGEGKTQEIFSLDDLVRTFSFAHVHKSGAIFDIKKLNWLNAQYIKMLSMAELYDAVLPFLSQKEFYQNAPTHCREKTYIEKVLTVERERLEKLSDVGEGHIFFFRAPQYDTGLLQWKEMTNDHLHTMLQSARKTLAAVSNDQWTKEVLHDVLLTAAGEHRGEFLWPLRVALSGEKKSPPPEEIAWVIGKEESLIRITHAIQQMMH